MRLLLQILDLIAGLFFRRLSPERLEARLTELADKHPERLDWKHSIVDLMKLNGMDSSLSNRKQLAKDWGYTGRLNGSADMNIWLHAEVMKKLARTL